ncbi:hypothetical protein CDAR_554641 [Caerostris darwini]|uniref:Uncharacterized protein n=1 Tax=Caerostris darwini TaxID=1538125 RepID=A0AAV4PIG9_9ARAC|nr:hypothetical protein CDAR_554641 [Caerostris darwini]
MADGMDTSSADGQSPFQGPLTPDDPASLQSSEHICKRLQQMANEKAAAEKSLSLHLNDPDIQADPVVLQSIENIVRRTSSKADFIDDQNQANQQVGNLFTTFFYKLEGGIYEPEICSVTKVSIFTKESVISLFSNFILTTLKVF